MIFTYSLSQYPLLASLQGLYHGDFCGFWTQTIMKLVVANFIPAEHHHLMSTERYNLNSQRENKP